MTLWRFGKDDLVPVILIVLLPLAIAAPQWLDWLKANPMLYYGALARDFVPGWLPGGPYIDPNNAFGTHALGRRAAMDWLQGTVPWWNPYSGVGLPLAAEYQPAAFFPLVFLLLLPQGPVWLQLSLQVLSGLGAYALLRQLGAGRLAATTGGLLYAVNGTLAWFAHAPALPVPFLPWVLLGIERARVAAALRIPGGWRLHAAAMAMSLLAAFPETAYLSGILAFAWAVLRGFQLERAVHLDYARRIAIGGALGIAFAAPQILPFFQFLPHADIGGHAADFAHSKLPGPAWIPSLVAPYFFGPFFHYSSHWTLLNHVWGGIGGYVTATIVVLAAYGFWVRRDALSMLLAAWIALCLAKTFGVGFVSSLWNLIPGVSITAFPRYAQPSWELAFVILAVFGLDHLARNATADRSASRAAWVAGALLLGATLAYSVRVWPHIAGSVGLRNWAVGATGWAVITAAACIFAMRLASPVRRARVIAAIVVFDASLMLFIPTLGNPRGGTVDIPAVHFLRDNLGLQRFFTLGPIQPNYGAFFRIASVNHNYLPVSERWVAWIRRHLDAGMGEPAVFNGGQPHSAAELRRNLDAYKWVGVKYVVAAGSENPFAGMPATHAAGIRSVYSDPALTIYELPNPAPYFETTGAACLLGVEGRTRIAAQCAGPATLVRRELFFPGWTATVNGAPAAIAEHREIFQAVALPAGRSEVRFDYAPPHILWAWLVSFAALAAWIYPTARRRLARR